VSEPLTIWQVHRDVTAEDDHPGVVAAFYTQGDAEDFCDLVASEQPAHEYWVLAVTLTGRPPVKRKAAQRLMQ